MAIAVLSVDLVAKLATFEADLKKAAGIAERQSGAMAKAFGLATAGAAGLMGALSAGGAAAIFKGIVDGVDALNDFADATGTSVENASALEDVAKRTGASMDTVQAAVLRLNKELSDAKPGSETERTLKAIGLNVKELRDLDPAEALLKVATALNGIGDSGSRARITQELFGKSTREVAAFLKDLAEQGKLVATVTKEQADQAEAFNKQLFGLQTTVTGLARDMAGPLVKALNETAVSMKAVKDSSGGFWQGLLDTAADAMMAGKRFEDAGEGATFYAGKLRELQAERSKVAGQKDRRALSDIDEEIARVGRLREYYIALYKVTAPDLGQSDSKERARRGRDVPGYGPPNIPDKPHKQKTIKDLQAETPYGLALALKAIDDTDIAKARELEAALSELYTLQRETHGDPAVVKAIKATKDALAQLTPEGKRAAEAQKLFAAALEDTPTAKLDVTTRAIELLNKRLADGKISIEEWAEAARLITKNAAADTSNKLDELSQFAAQAASNIQDAFGDTLLQTMKGSTSDIGKLWGDLIQRMLAQAAAAKFGEALFGKDFAKTGDIGGLAKDGFDWLKGIAKPTAGDKTVDTADTLTTGFSDVFDQITGTVKDKLGGGLESILSDIGSGLSSLLSSLFGGGSGGGSGFAGLLGALFSFDGGGYTGGGARSGGLDGKGGRLAILHPQETVLDHTKGQGVGGSTTNHWNITINDASNPAEVRRQVVAGIAEYDKRQRRRAAYGA